MNITRRWSSDGQPVFTPQETAGMKAYWAVYDANYDSLTKALEDLARQMPMLAGVMKRIPPEEMQARRKRSKELLRRAIMEGEWASWIEDLRQQGQGYATMGITFQDWFDLTGALKQLVLPKLVAAHSSSKDQLTAAVMGMDAYVDVALAMIGEAYLRTKERIIAEQQLAIHEMSTPVLRVRDRLLLLPVVGLLDTERARLLTQTLLHGIREHRARVVVIDITGVPAVDSKVANHLFQTVAAARLMGARSIVTGLSAAVAQALVTLGVDLAGLVTIADLQEGLEEADRWLSRRDLALGHAEDNNAAGGR